MNCILLSMNTSYQNYVNDIIGAALCSKKQLQCLINFVANFDPSIKYTYTTTDNSVTFFNLQLTIDNNHIESCVRFKPADSHN